MQMDQFIKDACLMIWKKDQEFKNGLMEWCMKEIGNLIKETDLELWKIQKKTFIKDNGWKVSSMEKE